MMRFKGRYVPDRNGKLKLVIKLMNINVDLPGSSNAYSSSLLKPPAWYGRLWLWLKSRT
jgi:hypothetical protein